jgi:hypothetical protein
VACALLAGSYNATVAGRSVPLMVLTFAASVADATTTVTYVPFLGVLANALHTRAAHGSTRAPKDPGVTLTQWLLVGEGLGGLLPVALSWIQTARGTDPANLCLPVFGFFLLLSLQMAFALAGFAFLLHWLARHADAGAELTNEPALVADGSPNGGGLNRAEQTSEERPRSRYRGELLLLMLVSFFMNGALPAVLSFSSKRFGDRAYHQSQTLWLVMNPLGAWLAGVHGQPSRLWLMVQAATAVGCSCFLIHMGTFSGVTDGDGTLLYLTTALASGQLAWVKVGGGGVCEVG